MQNVAIPTPDGVADAQLFQPAGTGPWPGVLFLMDGGGLRDALYAMGQRLADNGYCVLMPNLYYRSGPYQPFDMMTVFSPGNPERERISAMVRSLDNTAITRDLKAYLDALAQHARRGPAGVTGYCLGGGFAFLAAGQFPQRIAAAASFHGARLLTDRPDSPHLAIPKIRASIYLGIAEIDQMHTPEMTKQLEAGLSAARVQHEVEIYPKVAHGFAVSDTPVYNRDACELHWQRLLGHLSKALG
jgi:carboxymethylenebutenolidase